MNQYIEPIKAAVLAFPMVALLFTIPYMIAQYHKYGAILLLRTIIIYSFILYLMCTAFLTVLPLPDPETVRGLTSQKIQLIPFYELYDLFQIAKEDFTRTGTLLTLFSNRLMLKVLFQTLANIVMTLPFGIYLRYYFHCSLIKTVCFTLGLSFILELTQYSALFGVYPRPYRMADVDDLITNTLGGALGYWIAAPLMKLLPSRRRMDEVAYRRGTQVSVTRRAFAALMDGLILLGISCVLLLIYPWFLPQSGNKADMLIWCAGWYVFAIALYFMVGEYLLGGVTPGKRLMHLRLTDKRTGGKPKLWQYIVRYAVFYYVVFPTPILIFIALMFMKASGSEALWLGVGCAALLMVYVVFVLLLIVHVFTHSIQLLHDKLSMTKNVNTLRAEEDKGSALAADDGGSLQTR